MTWSVCRVSELSQSLPSWGPEGYLQQGAEPELGKAGGQTGKPWKNV